MKINRLLTAALITFATVFTGCVKESVWDRETGIDESKAAPEEFTYDEAASSKNAIAVYWNADKAVAAGAQSFLVQLTDENNMDKGNSWDSKVSKVFKVENGECETNAIFSGLKEYDCYYVRIRANYPGSVYSPWVYLVKEDGTPALMQIGHGEMPLVPSVTAVGLVYDINVTWGKCVGATKYVVEWKKTAETAWQSAETTETTYAISGLQDNTEYQVRVTAVSDQSYVSNVVTVATVERPPFPMEIASADEWIAFATGNIIGLANNGADDKVTLTADLDFTGKEYPADVVFKGVVDGNGKTIKNLQTAVPFFKQVTSVQNLTFDATCALTATTDGKYGMLAEVTTGTVTNVTNNGSVTVNLTEAPAAEALIAAGLVAEAEGDIVNSTNNGAVTVNSVEGLEASLAAGICGYASTKVTGCTNNGKVSQNSTHYIVSAWVTYKGIDRVPQHTGGIVAMSKDESLIENCTNTGNVVLNMTAIEKIKQSAGTNRIRIGGIAGAPRGDIKGCTNKGTVECYAMTSDRRAMSAASGKNYSVSPGGITGGQMDWGGKPDSGAGVDMGMDVINCVNEGDVIVDADVDGNNSTVGGIVSHPGWESINNTNTVENCINRGNITVRGGGLFRIGGINGGIANIVGCENYGTMTLATNTKAGSSIGGISGFMNNGSKFENNKNYGDIIESSDVAHTVAGLIGGVGNTESVTYGAGCAVKCSVTTAKSTTQAGMVFGAGAAKTTAEPHFGTEASPIKVAGTFNGTAVDASNVATTAKGSSSKGIMHVVFGE